MKRLFGDIMRTRNVFPDNMRRAYFAIATRHFGIAMIAVFEPLYILNILKEHNIPGGLPLVMVYFGVIFLFLALLMPFGARLASRVGLRAVILASVPFMFAYYTALFFANDDPRLFILASIMRIAESVLFWPAFHFFFAKSGKEAERGREVSTSILVAGMANLTGPAVGGIIITTFGFPVLFALVFTMLTFMALPFLFVQEERPAYKNSLISEFQNIFSPEFRRNAVAFAARGVEDAANAVLWPLFIHLRSISFIALGFIMSAATAVILAATLIVGRVADRVDKRIILRGGVSITALAWLSRILVVKPVEAFAANMFYGFGITMTAVPFASLYYDQVAREQVNPYHTVIGREIAMNLGRAAFFGLCAVVFLITTSVGLIFPFISVITFLIAVI